jgi:signal transduction histidine kinase
VQHGAVLGDVDLLAANMAQRAGAFLRELAHEVGNAVHPMSLIVQVLAQPDLNPAMIERLKQGLERQLPSLEELVRDLRRVSLIARDAAEPRRQAIDPGALLRRAAANFQPRAEAADVVLEVQIPEDLPQANADADLLEQAAAELLDNAARHTPSGGRIRLAARAEGNDLAICVADNGAGIAPELLPHVFDLFVRGDETENAPPAWGRFGVGLTFVRQVARKHGGRVVAESAGPGQGASFTLRLPAC